MDELPRPGPLPGVRGTFDEETCRMYLHGLGNGILTNCPFACGIWEIYWRLLYVYGRSQIADAISVFHELLEDESYEGYIWRRWRHDWRHRNDDILNPFVPAFDDFVFPPPTSRCIRALKVANFWLTRNRRAGPTHDEHRPSFISWHSDSHPSGSDHVGSTGPVVGNEPLREIGQDISQASHITRGQHWNVASEANLQDGVFYTQEEGLLPKESETNLSSKSSSGCTDAGRHNEEGNPTGEAEPAARAGNDDDSDTDSQQEFDDVTGDVDHSDNPNLVIFELMTNEIRHMPGSGRPQSGPAVTVALRPIYSGDSTNEVEGDAEAVRRSPSEDSDYDGDVSDEDSTEEEVENVPETEQSSVGLDQGPPLASSQMLKVSYPAFTSDAGSNIEESFDRSAAHPAHPTRPDEVIDDEAQLFLPDRAYLDEVPRMSLSAVKSYTIEKTSPSISTVSDHASFHSRRASRVDPFKSDHREIAAVDRKVVSLSPRRLISPTPGRFPIDSPREEEISQIQSHKCKPNDHGEGVTCSRVSYERYPIDGHNEGAANSGRLSALLRRKETLPNQLIQRGRSLLQRMPKILRKVRKGKRTKQQGQHATQDTSATTRGLFRRKSSKAGWCAGAGNHSPPAFRPKRTTPGYTFDGACDEDDTTSTMTTVDLNKALPPHPIESKNKATISSRAGTPSLTNSHESNTRPSTTSTGSSNLSRVSSKKRFHRTAHELVRPNMADSRNPSPLRQDDPDKFLVASKYDPLASPKLPDTPMTFSSFNNANPFMDQYDEFIPPMPAPSIAELRSPDPVKVSRGHGIPQSRSEGQICSPKPLQIKSNRYRYQLGQSDGTNDHGNPQPRGRVPSRDISHATESVPGSDEKAAASRTESRKRSRSPVKRFLGLGKSQSMKEIPQEKDTNDESDKKAGLKLWGDRLRHGFLTSTESKPSMDSSQREASKTRTPPRSTFPISIGPDQQAKIYCEVELMICTTANKFLSTQRKAGLMSADSVSKVLTQWTNKNRPQVVEFQFDQATQRDLILYNINTFRFHGEARTNPMVLNSTMYAWKVMAKEMSVRTFCMPDSVIRKHLHDAHKVLELLGAGLTTFLFLQELQVDALKIIAEAQKKRIDREHKRQEAEKADGNGRGSAKARKFTPPTPATSFASAPMSAFMDEETLFEDPYEG